jgi:hypothetical protein
MCLADSGKDARSQAERAFWALPLGKELWKPRGLSTIAGRRNSTAQIKRFMTLVFRIAHTIIFHNKQALAINSQITTLMATIISAGSLMPPDASMITFGPTTKPMNKIAPLRTTYLKPERFLALSCSL